MSNVARAMHGMAGAGLAARLGHVGPSGGLFCQDPGLQDSRAPPHPIKRWHRFHALLPNGCFSRCAGLSAGWIQCFGGGTDREGRGFCLGTECPETWGSIVVPMSGFRDLLPSVGTLMELLQRERLRGLSAWVKRWMASASGMEEWTARERLWWSYVQASVLDLAGTMSLSA